MKNKLHQSKKHLQATSFSYSFEYSVKLREKKKLSGPGFLFDICWYLTVWPHESLSTFLNFSFLTWKIQKVGNLILKVPWGSEILSVGVEMPKTKPQCSSGVLKIWLFSTSKGPEVSRKCFIKSTLLKYNLYAIKCT